jgi:hypothetical protein
VGLNPLVTQGTKLIVLVSLQQVRTRQVNVM